MCKKKFPARITARIKTGRKWTSFKEYGMKILYLYIDIFWKMSIFVYISLGLTIGGCSTTNNTFIYDSSSVNSIDIYKDQLPYSSQDKYVKSITHRDTIKEIVDWVNKNQQGWKPCTETPSSGKIVIEFFKDDGDILFCIRFSPRNNGGEIQMDINGKTCWREISQTDKQQLLTLLDITLE
jgi:hypothetical protein